MPNGKTIGGPHHAPVFEPFRFEISTIPRRSPKIRAPPTPPPPLEGRCVAGAVVRRAANARSFSSLSSPLKVRRLVMYYGGRGDIYIHVASSVIVNKR